MTNLFALLSLSATAGFLAFFSPCGYALLPAYVGFFLADSSSKTPLGKTPQKSEDSRQAVKEKSDTPAGPLKQTDSTKKLATRGLLMGLFVVLGFVTVLAVLWIIVALLGNIIGSFLPKLALAVGIILVLAGIYLVFKPAKFSIPLPKFFNRTRHGLGGAYLFGLAYIIGGIGCTLPIFIAVLSQAALLGPAQSLLTFAAFSGTMSLLLLIITLLLVVARQALFKKLKKLLPYVQKAGAILLVIAGIYLLITEI